MSHRYTHSITHFSICWSHRNRGHKLLLIYSKVIKQLLNQSFWTKKDIISIRKRLIKNNLFAHVMWWMFSIELLEIVDKFFLFLLWLRQMFVWKKNGNSFLGIFHSCNALVWAIDWVQKLTFDLNSFCVTINSTSIHEEQSIC